MTGYQYTSTRITKITPPPKSLKIPRAGEELDNGTGISVSCTLCLQFNFIGDCLSHHYGFLPVMMVEKICFLKKLNMQLATSFLRFPRKRASESIMSIQLPVFEWSWQIYSQSPNLETAGCPFISEQVKITAHKYIQWNEYYSAIKKKAMTDTCSKSQ